jgi:phosphatidylglycerol:prolipoprotein diacylglycerol transferase
MHPTLIRIPFLHLTIWSFGAMAVLGFLAALLLVRHMSRRAGLDPAVMSDIALYALILGMVGARAFYVAHHVEQFRGDLLSVIAVWRGGLEFVGGVIPALAFLLFYLHRRKLPVRRYLDIVTVGLMMGLAFGRIGCLLNGCCFGRPADLPWAIRFPYGSNAYISQVNADPKRDRAEPHLKLPHAEYFSFADEHGYWYPKLLPELTPQQRYEVTKGRYRCLPVHPTQPYASANALLLCAILYIAWRMSSMRPDVEGSERRLWRPGLTIALALVLYGVTRFLLESVRDDNPFELASLTISQIVAIIMVALGAALLTALVMVRPGLPGDISAGRTDEPDHE